jgi:alpha-N-arabinofuranosidase
MYPSSLDAWTAVGDSTLSLQSLSNPLSSALPTSVEVAGKGTVGLSNEGFWGIDVRPQKYSGSFYVKGSYKGSFTASLQSSTSGKTLASVKVASKSVANEWIQHEFTLTPETTASDTNNTFSLTFDASVGLNI